MEIITKEYNVYNFSELSEDAKVLLDDGNITKDMIVRGKYGNLEWRDHADRFVKAWRI